MTELLVLSEVAKLLNFSEEEIMELVRQKRMPNIHFPNGYELAGEIEEYVFPKEDVLAAFTPRPATEAETKGPVVPRRGRPKK